MKNMNREVVIKQIDEYRFREPKAILPVTEMIDQLDALYKQSAMVEKDNLVPLNPWIASGDLVSLTWKFSA